MNKAFTLIELLGVIVILAVISLIAFPAVLSLINSSTEKTDKAMQDVIKTAAAEYVNDNINDFPKQLTSKSETKEYGDNGNITTEFLIENGYISSTEINKNNHCELLDDYVKVTSDSKKYSYEYKTVDTNEACK